MLPRRESLPCPVSIAQGEVKEAQPQSASERLSREQIPHAHSRKPHWLERAITRPPVRSSRLTTASVVDFLLVCTGGTGAVVRKSTVDQEEQRSGTRPPLQPVTVATRTSTALAWDSLLSSLDLRRVLEMEGPLRPLRGVAPMAMSGDAHAVVRNSHGPGCRRSGLPGTLGGGRCGPCRSSIATCIPVYLMYIYLTSDMLLQSVYHTRSREYSDSVRW
ncbi:hypothetical protein C8Q78DRAFT_86322 [Trametes maxima]|nr:hypothetical protein C8Q78DRAFT_86322 [Trametes maxima]